MTKSQTRMNTLYTRVRSHNFTQGHFNTAPPSSPKPANARWPPHGRLSRRWLMSFLCYSSHRPSTTVLEGPDRGIILFRDSSSPPRSVTADNADNFAGDGAFDEI